MDDTQHPTSSDYANATVHANDQFNHDDDDDDHGDICDVRDDNDDHDHDHVSDADIPRRAPLNRRMSPERRAKISAALKGRRKSASHRESLRRRFVGHGNPMYGRKLSAESRAKISRSLAARKHQDDKDKNKDQEDDVKQNEKAIDHLREKAVTSRLFSSNPHGMKRRTPQQRKRDEAEAMELDRIIEKVRLLQTPPEAVKKQWLRARHQRQSRDGTGGDSQGDEDDGVTSAENMYELEDKTQVEHTKQRRDSVGASTKKKMINAVDCERCHGSGMEKCHECVLAFGVVSSRCDMCLGAGAVFCGRCEGVGSAHV